MSINSAGIARSQIACLIGVLVVTAFAILAGPAPAQAADVNLYAAPNALGAGDCSSPEDACLIVDAVAEANSASVADDVTVLLDKGNYPLSSQDPTALAVTFAGPSLTFVGRNGTPTLNGSSAVRIMSVAVGSNVSIDGLEFAFGSSTGLGGAIENLGNLTIEDSRFVGNSAANGGALQSAVGTTLAVEDSSFSYNKAASVGGGAIIAFGTATIERSAFFNNSAPVNGGAINVQPGSTFTLVSSTLAANTSSGLGGAISNLGTIDIFSSTVIDNKGNSGGVIATGNTDATAAASIFTSSGSGDSCNPAGTAIVDAGYNLDDDGTCIPATPGPGSHSGTSSYGTSTYGAILDSYLADRAENNGGPTRTFALLNSPDPATELANPALGVVPTSFDFPTPVGGETKACALADQRGVLPAAGASCDIGAYLLQETSVELTSSAESVEQNEPVTYTATVSPAPDGGTVSFNDGNGNPATNQCGTKHLANGVATCTVSYPDTGTYPVTASYTGDGAKNNFTPSNSIQPTNVTTTVTATPPPVVDRPLRFISSTSNRQTGVNTIKIGIPAAGTVQLIGYRKLKSTSRRFEAKGVYGIQAVPKGKLLRDLNKRGRGRAIVKIKYIPDAGRAIAKSVVYPFAKSIR